jgi:surfeit locus 1 family protein
VTVRSVLTALLVGAVAAVCVRLGFWQISRLHEKQALNAAMDRALAMPPLELSELGGAPDSVVGRRVAVRGTFDEARQVLLSARTYNGSPGVHVVTPLVVGAHAVLVDRGWLPADDAATARPQRYLEPGEREVVGIAEAIAHGAGGLASRVIEADSVRLISARRLDFDSLSAAFPYALAGFAVRQLPGPGVPAEPVRTPPKHFDETMHVSYAVQWFLFATILVVGSIALAWSRRGGRGAPIPDVPEREA